MATKTERAEQANRLLAAIAGCGRKFFAHNGRVSRFEVDERGRIWFVDAYREGCLPGPGETARITSDGRTAQCRIYSTASLTRGMAPRLVSAAAVEVRQP